MNNKIKRVRKETKKVKIIKSSLSLSLTLSLTLSLSVTHTTVTVRQLTIYISSVLIDETKPAGISNSQKKLLYTLILKD